MARTHEYVNSSGRGMLVSSISPVYSTVPNFDVQPTFSSDVQSIHSDNATFATSFITIAAASSHTIGTCSIYTLLTNSAVPGHPLSTVNFPCFCRLSIPTTPKHSVLTYRSYQGIRL